MQSYDWNLHFRRISAKADFGTIAGLHTSSDLTNIYNATDGNVNAVAKIRDNLANSNAWANADPSGWSKFLIDVANLQNDWTTESVIAQKYMNGVLSYDVQLTDNAYNDVNNINTRAVTLLSHAQNSPVGHTSDVSQPITQTAVTVMPSLNADNQAAQNDAINKVPNPIQAITDPWQFMKDNWKLILVGVTALVGTGLVLHAAGKLTPLALV